MSQTNVPITPGSGKNIDGFQTSSTGNVRQSIVLADPSTDANTTPVHATLGAGINVLGANGSALDTNSGTKSAGTIRVVLATDQPQLTNSTITTGDTASGSSDAGNPNKIGGVGKTSNPTAVTDGQRVNAIFDKLGKQVVVGSIRDLKVNQITTITSSTSETTVLTAVASTFLDVYGVICVNSSGTATNVSFKDATSGTTRFNIYIPAGETRGFMLPESGAVAQSAVNNNWTATSSQSISSLIITMLAVKNI